MSEPQQRTLIHDAIDCLKAHDRRKAVELIKEYMAQRQEPSPVWKSVGRLCDEIGEIDLALEAKRRFAAIKPVTIERQFDYWTELIRRGRPQQCLAELQKIPEDKFETDPAVVHLRAIIATQLGEFDIAEPLLRKNLERAQLPGQSWLSLATIKKFEPGDPDIAAMESLRSKIKSAPPAVQAPFFYALGKAYHDVKDYDRAFEAYSEGARIKRNNEEYDAEGRKAFTDRLIKNFTPENMKKLIPSGCDSNRPIFVTGLPRSGTTLVEQILTSHSEVAGGAELNLLRASLMPTGNFSFEGALAYQEREAGNPDPWGDIGRGYLDLLSQRFGAEGRIVDKTLNHSRFMGLLLHTLPGARVIWMRRNPEDTAISAFRNFFATSRDGSAMSVVRWSWDLADTGSYFRCDDALYAHWMKHFSDRILTVPYEELVTSPREWITKILAHVGLEEEEAVFEPHKQKDRPVMTASVAQVRQPISAKQVGAAAAYDKYMQPFRDAYAGKY